MAKSDRARAGERANKQTRVQQVAPGAQSARQPGVKCSIIVIFHVGQLWRRARRATIDRKSGGPEPRNWSSCAGRAVVSWQFVAQIEAAGKDYDSPLPALDLVRRPARCERLTNFAPVPRLPMGEFQFEKFSKTHTHEPFR